MREDSKASRRSHRSGNHRERRLGNRAPAEPRHKRNVARVTERNKPPSEFDTVQAPTTEQECEETSWIKKADAVSGRRKAPGVYRQIEKAQKRLSDTPVTSGPNWLRRWWWWCWVCVAVCWCVCVLVVVGCWLVVTSCCSLLLVEQLVNKSGALSEGRETRRTKYCLFEGLQRYADVWW